MYDRLSRYYDLLAERREAPARMQGLELLDARPGENVLDIGCGTGRSLAVLGQAVGPFGRVHGIDLSEGMLRIARRHVRLLALEDRVAVRAGDATELPFKRGSMDALFISFTLELFDTPEIPRVLAECRRVLRPDGRMVVIGVTKDGESGPMLRLFEWAHRHFPALIDCRPIYVQRAVEAAGFLVQQVRRSSVGLPVEIVLARRTLGPDPQPRSCVN